MPRRKSPVVSITNPAFSSGKIPKPLGTSSPTPLPLAPITPVQTPRSRQIVASDRVRFTDGRRSL